MFFEILRVFLEIALPAIIVCGSLGVVWVYYVVFVLKFGNEK